MRIGLVGYFGWGNYGDELFHETYQQWFAGHELIMFHDAAKGGFVENMQELIDSVDAIVIGGGDLVIPWFKSWLYWDERFLKKPVFVFGVGVPTWGKIDPNVIAHYRKFLSHSSVKFIACRDEESVGWINTQIAPGKELHYFPDMVLALNFPQRDLASRHVGLILRKQDHYVSEHVERLATRVAQLGYSIRMILLGTDRTLSDDYEVFSKIRLPSYEVVVRDSTARLSEELARCAYVVSMKFHGIVAAYKCSVPFISLSGADKFKSFVKQTGNDQYSSTWSDPALADKFERLVLEGMDFSKRTSLVAAARSGLDRLKSEVLAQSRI